MFNIGIDNEGRGRHEGNAQPSRLFKPQRASTVVQ